MKNTITTLLGSALLATGIASAHLAPANAVVMASSSCNTTDVVGSANCTVGVASQDDVSENKDLTVNLENFFGSSDWEYATKIELASNKGQSGTWDLSSILQNTWDDVMVVFKGGKNTTITGFLLEDGVKSFNWDTPFGVKDVSHISLYYRNGGDVQPPAAVPEPASLMGLGLVASGMVMARRRKSSQSA